MNEDENVIWSVIYRLQSELQDAMESDDDEKRKEAESIGMEIKILLDRVIQL